MNAGKIRGHATALELLERALAQDRVAHAYAFVGPSGIGKKLTALAFAQALLCPSFSFRPLTLPSRSPSSLFPPHPARSPSGGGDKATLSSPQAGEDGGEGVGRERFGGCGSCSACRRVKAGTHPDCLLVAPDGQTIKIEQIRELARLVTLRPLEGPRKIFIIDEADRMPPVTANALLKTLEEPPDRTVLILILSQLRALPPTALSRCQVVRFAPLAEAEAVAVLQERGVDDATSRFLARACQGRVGLALGRDPAAWREQRDNAVALLRAVSAEGGETLFNAVEALGRDRTQAAALIETVWHWHRDLLCVKAGGDPRLVMAGDRLAELSQAAGATPWEAIVEALVACREAWHALQGNVSPRLTLEVLLSRLALKAA